MDEFDAIISHAKRIVSTSHTIAADAFPNGGALRCARCGHSQTFTRQHAARYLSTGWPMCHGATMSVEQAVTREARPDAD